MSTPCPFCSRAPCRIREHRDGYDDPMPGLHVRVAAQPSTPALCPGARELLFLGRDRFQHHIVGIGERFHAGDGQRVRDVAQRDAGLLEIFEGLVRAGQSVLTVPAAIFP